MTTPLRIRPGEEVELKIFSPEGKEIYSCRPGFSN